MTGSASVVDGFQCEECVRLWNDLNRADREHQIALAMLSISQERRVEKNFAGLTKAIGVWAAQRDEAYQRYSDHQRQHLAKAASGGR